MRDYPRIIVKVEEVKVHRNIEQMVKEVGWQSILPDAGSQDAAIKVYQHLGKTFKSYLGEMVALKVQYVREELEDPNPEATQALAEKKSKKEKVAKAEKKSKKEKVAKPKVQPTKEKVEKQDEEKQVHE